MYTGGDTLGRRRRDWRELLAAFVGGAGLSALVTVLIVHGSNGNRGVITSTEGSTTTTLRVASPASATSAVTSSVGATAVKTTPSSITSPTSMSAPPASPPTVASPGELTGTVTDYAGHPVAGAYVIGLQTLDVARTDAAGRYSMSCNVTVNGVISKRAEPLVASPWLLPVEPTGQGSYALGRNTTNYGPPPSTPGLGYAFSGGALDSAHAEVVSCPAAPMDFVLEPGGSVDLQIVDTTGRPSSAPPDNLYLPGLGDNAALETVPLSGDGRQLMAQMASGELRIDGTVNLLSCSGSGVTPDPSVGGADVAVVAGHTTLVVCRVS